jgi:hypothetical protein
VPDPLVSSAPDGPLRYRLQAVGLDGTRRWLAAVVAPRYLLEAVRRDGSRTQFGPIDVVG